MNLLKNKKMALTVLECKIEKHSFLFLSEIILVSKFDKIKTWVGRAANCSVENRKLKEIKCRSEL